MIKKFCCLCLFLILLSPIVFAQEADMSQVVTMQQLEEIGKSAVAAKLGGSEDYEITTSYLPSSDISVPQGEVTLKTEIPYGIRLNTPTIVNVAICVDGTIYENVGIRFTVRKFANVLVAARNIAAHEIFTKDCVRYERRDAGRLPIGYVQNVSQIEGLAARQILREGVLITKGVIEKPVLIKRGSIIKLVARIGNIEVTTDGQALDNGAAGQVIRVRNLNTKKNIPAQVLDETTAQVLTYSGR